MTKKNLKKIEELIKELLNQIGEDTNREGIIRTPKRVANAWDYFSKGYNQDLDSIINNAISDGVFPGSQLFVSKGNQILVSKSFGK